MDDPLPIGEIVIATRSYSLSQLCAVCGVHAERLIALVATGIVEPTGTHPAAWRFDDAAMHRAQKALRLHRDLLLDLHGLALVLDLLDEIDRLRTRLARAQS